MEGTITKQTLSRNFLERLTVSYMEGMISKQAQSQLPWGLRAPIYGKNDKQGPSRSFLEAFRVVICEVGSVRL
jgi:hypothetical protein